MRPTVVTGGVCLAIALTGVGFRPAPAVAQVLYGSLVGNVTDPSQAPVPGAIVSITNTSTNQVREAVTNAVGVFNFPTIAAGAYDVRVTRDGFRSATRQGVVVTINSVARADIALQLGAVSESITVAATAASLQTDRSEVRSEVTSKTLVNVPVPPGRNYQQLLKVLPGITPPGNAHSIPSNPSRSLRYNVNGTSSSSNDVRVDGASQYNVWLPHVTAYVPALESIDTVNVVTNSFDAEQGLAGGSTINVQIKSGGNDLHGSAFWYHNDNATKAKPFFLPQGQRNPKAVFNQFGATVGGPIRKDKLFYFASYEGTTDRQFASRFATVPTQAIRNGDMRESGRPVYDPRTGTLDGRGRTPFPGDQVPRSLFDPISLKIVALTPQPTFPQDLTNNYFANAPFSFDRKTLDTKVNWNATDRLSMYARFSLLRYTQDNQQYFGAALGGPPINGGNPGHGFGGTYSGTIAATYAFSPNFILDGNFGYTLMDTNVEQPRLSEKIGLDVLGIPGTNGPRRFEGGWPRFSISNYTNVGINEAFMPYFRTDPQFHYVANANLTKGSHNLRFGFDIARQDLNHTQPEFPGASHGGQGGFTFGGGPTTVRGGPASNQFNSYATFLLGLPTTIGKILQVPDEYTTRTWQYSLYVRDQWQASRKLTLSYGVRWELFPVPTRTERGMERYDFQRNKMLVCGVGVVPADCGSSIGKKGFAPRVGFAYRATDTFVIRAGYGITNDPYNLARPLRTNHPVLLALNIVGDNAFLPAGRLRDGIPLIKAPELGNGIIDIPGTVGVNTLGDQVERGYIQSWNFTLQKELGWGFVAQAGYVATRQIRQLGFLDLNVGRPGGGRASQPLNQKFGRNARSALVAPLGNTQYDSLQTNIERRFAGGFQLQASYTWSKTMGICCNANSDGNPAIQLPEFYHLNRSVSGIHIPHNFQAIGFAELPFGRNKPWANGGGIGSAILGGWQVNGIFSAISGPPFHVTASGNSLDAPGNSQRADQVKQNVQKLGGTGRDQSFFDPFAYAAVTEARFGTAGFNSLQGPGTVNLDFGLFRRFQVSERVNLEFRAEAFNFTNTPHFSNPGTNVSNLQLNPDGSIRRRGGYTEITGTRGTGREGIDERVFRFGIRIGF